MAATSRRHAVPNADLARLLAEAGLSHKALARLVNERGRLAGIVLRYEHTSVTRWVNSGMVPRGRTPEFVAAVLAERLGRPVRTDDIGMSTTSTPAPTMGLDFPRDPADAVRVASTYWRTPVDSRRRFLTTGFALGAYTMPVTRWLAKPATAATPPSAPAGPGAGRVGRTDLDGLWAASEEARVWDSRFGGGHWQNSSVTRCLQTQAAPLLRGTYTETVGRELFAATAELSRVVGWAAFDAGHHDVAQRHFIQALSLARSAGDIETGCYVLTTMALQTMLRGFPEQAADMAEGAYERARGHAAPRVLAFAKLAEARAHGRMKDGAAAGAALAQAELLLDAVQPGAHDPQHLAYFTPERLAADAIEIHRDLGQPQAALNWNRLAEPMPAGRFTRAVGIRHAVLASSHTHAGDLDRALSTADHALGILGTVHSTRAHAYLHTVTTDLQRWPRDPRVRDFAVRVHTLVGSPHR